VTNNPQVRAGINWAGLKWALGTGEAANWHPLTWVSHMLDCQVYGPRAGGHHLTSVLLHVVNSWLLFALLLRMTGRRGRSFVVAALFAWHPLHVESVAWVAERKDVLSACFGLLTLLAYARYAEIQSLKSKVQSLASDGRSPKPGGSGRWSPSFLPSSLFYVLALFFFALGLMSKPMLVTWPFVLLLLDYWPLGRTAEGSGRRAGWGRLLLEKGPFLLLAALSCGVTVWAQSRWGAVVAVKALPPTYRIANAVLSYYRYIGKTLWPTHLAAFYPYGHPYLSGQIVLGGAALAGFSAVASSLRKYPYVAVGWFWFAGMLVPVIGLVQVGGQAMADRYTYLPSIGLFILGVFGLSELAARFRHGAAWLTVITVLALAGCLAATQRQVGYWRNSETLSRHAIAVTQRNFAAYNNLGNVLYLQGKKEEALGCFREAVRWKPDYAEAHCSLAITYGALERRGEAQAEFQIALQLNPKLERAHYRLANELLAGGDMAGAMEHYQSALILEPDHPEAHYELAVVLLGRNEVAEASRHYREAVRLRPDWVEALNNFAWLLATQPEARFRDGREAVELAARGVVLTQTNNAGALDTLGAALAEAGRFPEAVKAAQSAARLAQASGAAQLAREIEARRQGYERGQPFREARTAGRKSGGN
jgi:tetratricopeptide (TPR) repeat protein